MTDPAELRARHTCIMAASSMRCLACDRGVPYPALTSDEMDDAMGVSKAPSMTTDHRALIAAGRAHDEAMTDSPWTHRQALHPSGEVSHDVVEDPRGQTVAYDSDGEAADFEERNAAGIAWMRTNLRALLDGYAAALDELDHATAHDGDHLSKASRRMVDTVMGDREALRQKVAELEERVIHWRQARQSGVAAGEVLKQQRDELRDQLAFTDRSLTAAIEQSDVWRTRAQQLAARVSVIESALRKIHDDALYDDNSERYREIAAILDQGEP